MELKHNLTDIRNALSKVMDSLQWEKMRDTTLEIYTNYYEAKPALVLMNYIKKATLIWNYGEN